MPDLEVDAINFPERLVLWSDGTTTKMTKVFDRDGEETDNPREAVTAVAPCPDGQWATIELSEYSKASIN